MASEILRMTGISKSYPGVKALKDVSFSVQKGEIHVLVGENGAGKSTLMKILAGAQRADAGQIAINGKAILHPMPEVMLRHGLAVIYQELMLAPHLNVAENIFLGRFPKYGPFIVDWSATQKEATQLIERLGFHLDPKARLSSLTVAQRQLVEIAKALSLNAKLVVLDEPSAVLGEKEIENLFRVMKGLSQEGISFIYISHRLKEVFQIAHRITVLRDGAVVVSSQPVGEVSEEQLVRWMVGRDIAHYLPIRAQSGSKALLKVTGLQRKGVLHDISFEVREGEILGICGLAGSGRTEVLRAIIGADPVDGGLVEYCGQPVSIRSPRQALRLGIGLVPEDRKQQGLFLSQSVAFNVTISNIRNSLRGGFINQAKEKSSVQRLVKSLQIKTPTLQVRVTNLSGGNQQKCVLAKKLNANCRLLLVDEPTRGIDVGAKREIYQLFFDLLQREGMAIVIVSSELPEVLRCSDRILVMRQGRIAAEFDRKEASEEAIMRFAT
jgi:ribose transport system ATP-binding protein